MLFNQIVGQEKIKNSLLQAVKEERISHAQLFLGPAGYGGLPMAIAYAQYISCLDKGENDVCGKCSSCVKFSKLAHPDLHFIFPVSTTKKVTKDPVSDDFIADWREKLLENPYFDLNNWYAKIGIENKQGIIGRTESSQIIKKVSLKTFESDYRFIIIWMPEKMNVTAANKLLKILEEPPERSLFLMVGEYANQLLPTIISRTQIIKLPRIDDHKIREACNAQASTAGEDELDQIVKLANGNYLSALKYLNSRVTNNRNFEIFVDVMRLCYKPDIKGLVNWVDEISGFNREDQKAFLEYAIQLIRNNFMMNLKVDEVVYLDAKETAFSQKFSPFIKPENAGSIYEELNKAFGDIERNAYGKTVFLDLGLKISKLLKA